MKRKNDSDLALGDLTWSWDFSEYRDRGISSARIFDATYPKPALTRKQAKKIVDAAVQEVKNSKFGKK